MTSSRDYAVKITVRNGRILDRMRKVGIKTQSDLAERAGLSTVSVNSLITLRRPAMKDNGQWRYGVEEIAAVLRCDPEDLFTDAQMTMALERNSVETYLDEPAVMALSSGDPERAAWAKIEAQRLLAAVPPRYADIAMRVAGGETLDSIGEDYGFSREKVRQMDLKAHRMMRRRAEVDSKGVAWEILTSN